MISGSSERHVKAGSKLILYCQVEQSSGEPDYVYWYRDGRVINYSGRPGVNIFTGSAAAAAAAAAAEEEEEEEEGEVHPPAAAAVITEERKLKRRRRKQHWGPKTSPLPRRSRPVSALEVSNVTSADAGEYMCAPSNAKNYSVVVHVVKGTTVLATFIEA